MHSTQATSSDSWCSWVPFAGNDCKNIILVALGVIAVGGGMIGISGVIGYLPPLTICVGEATCIAAIISIAVLALCRERSGLANSQSEHMVSILAPFQHSCAIVQAAQHTTAYQSMITLVEDGRIKEAWQLYLSTSFEEKQGCKPQTEIQEDAYLGQTGWLYLPPEQLLNAIMNHWLSREENITVCPEFIRDCANQYADFRNKCLAEDRLWSCFSGYQEYIADIAAVHPTFGLEVMMSLRGVDISGDDYRIKIFRSSFNSLLSIIEENAIDEWKIKFFANFLLCYQLVIHDEDFEKIKQIRLDLIKQRDLHDTESEEYKNYSLYMTLMDLVEGKLSFQGIYRGERGSTYFPPVVTDLVSGLFDLHWIEEVTRKISVATDDENIRKGLLYLSLISQSNTHYIDAQLMLGNIWLDLENFSEAGRYFFYIAQLKNEHSPDAIMLASMSLLAAVKEDKGWTFVLREDMERLANMNKEVRTLNPEECKSLNVEQLIETIERLKKEKNT